MNTVSKVWDKVLLNLANNRFFNFCLPYSLYLASLSNKPPLSNKPHLKDPERIEPPGAK
jgi:hypothetical protein